MYLAELQEIFKEVQRFSGEQWRHSVDMSSAMVHNKIQQIICEVWSSTAIHATLVVLYWCFCGCPVDDLLRRDSLFNAVQSLHAKCSRPSLDTCGEFMLS